MTSSATPAGSDSTPGVFARQTGHEQVVYCSDPASGLRAIVAIYSTALGPSLGGTRFFPYASEADALEDVLDLSTAMAYKAALAGLDLGGGKAVIIGDPARDKSEALLRAYGRFVQSHGGRYYTACDVGTYAPDMDIVARECAFVTGRSVEYGGAGDSSVLTAYGVYQGMLACAERIRGTDPQATNLQGLRVGIAGVGKVGRHLAVRLIEAGARVVATDVDERAIERLRAERPEVEVVGSTHELVRAPLDVYAPCALGGALDDETVAVLRAQAVCGAANNQLAHPGIDKALEARGIRYAPDYCVNAGGLIQVADEIGGGFDFERAKSHASRIRDTTRRVFDLADEEGVPPAVAADRLAERRMSEVGRLRGLWLPGSHMTT